MCFQSLLPFSIEVVPGGDGVTARAGATLVYEMMRVFGLRELVAKHVRIQQRQGGHSDFDKIADIVLTLATGGDCVDDVRILHADPGLCRLLGRTPASASTLLQLLYEFHDDGLLLAAQENAKQKDREAYIVEENAALAGLGKVNEEFTRRIAKHLGLRRATLDHDATIQESHKKQAKAHYKKGRGYQPAAIYWVEADQVVGDEYRDGNVGAGMENLPLIKRGFAMLPKWICEYYFRADTASYDIDVLKWLANENRANGPQGHIGFTIGADMTEALQAVCKKVPEEQWVVLEERIDETVYCTEVEFTPGDKWSKTAQPLRYLAVRIRKRQGLLFAAGNDTKYLAVVTNRQGQVAVLLRWHWQKAGTIELVHDVMKNELGAGVPPCARLGANAAWYRLSALTYNILSGLKSLALRAEYESARPKKLRAMVLTLPARIISHAGRLVVQISEQAEKMAGIIEARRKLLMVLKEPAAA
ncbi:MAG: hypothetical protein A2289_11800 [Deltaproteobacteria bacterium RIFOXYA12_FULL_58_15]|nr:MAG: hypothetical protein A2289_11800 [Deltaproteobacteria bacterium RIFOXYA12_FULL_58_15]